MQLIKAIEFFEGVNAIGAKIIWYIFMEEIGPELLADLKGQPEPRYAESPSLLELTFPYSLNGQLWLRSTKKPEL